MSADRSAHGATMSDVWCERLCKVGELVPTRRVDASVDHTDVQPNAGKGGKDAKEGRIVLRFEPPTITVGCDLIDEFQAATREVIQDSKRCPRKELEGSEDAAALDAC